MNEAAKLDPIGASPGDTLAAARAGDQRAFGALVAPYERELRAFCYKMSGSLHDADDLLQDSLVRAWRGLPTFEGRASLRVWLYRVTWSACADALKTRAARRLAVEHGPPADPRAPLPAAVLDGWIGPCPASLYADERPSPEARYSASESVALAFLAALQLLPARQRAVLLARDVLGLSAEASAEMLGSSVTSANSALQRARQTLEDRAPAWRPSLPDEATTRTLLARYVEAWQEADVAALVSLLHEEATLAMPPLPMWLRGPHDIGQSIAAMVLTPDARGAFQLVLTEANGSPALAAYRRQPDGAFAAAALHVLSLGDDCVVAMTAFLDPGLFPAFGLATTL
jgi:RNA polymerase sigma-70 factor, ECF subfamily